MQSVGFAYNISERVCRVVESDSEGKGPRNGPMRGDPQLPKNPSEDCGRVAPVWASCRRIPERISGHVEDPAPQIAKETVQEMDASAKSPSKDDSTYIGGQ